MAKQSIADGVSSTVPFFPIPARDIAGVFTVPQGLPAGAVRAQAAQLTRFISGTVTQLSEGGFEEIRDEMFYLLQFALEAVTALNNSVE